MADHTSAQLTPVHGVIFDYGKVLSLPPTAEDWKRLAAACCIAPVERFEQLYWEFRDGYDVNECDGAGYWQQVGAAGGVKPTDYQRYPTAADAHVGSGPYDAVRIKHIIALDNVQWTRPNDSMIELARRLRSAGLKTAVLSNIQWDMLSVMRAKFPWLDEFATRTYTCEVLMVKPAAEVYLMTCRNMGLKPENVLFIDDKQVNIDGALRAGLQGCLFDFPARQSEVENYLKERGFRE